MSAEPSATTPACPADRRLACVTVTYRPDLVILRAQLDALPRDSLKLVIDNASPPDQQAALAACVERVPGARLLRNPANLGLAAAINRGARAAAALDPAPTGLLLLDQDSEPLPGSVETLLAALAEGQGRQPVVAAVGPLLEDADSGLTHGFHRAGRWRWRRLYPPPDAAPLEVSNLNGSGTLVPLALFLKLGGLDEALFIDHVDTEWSFRALAAGYRLLGVPRARWRHRMGAGSIRYWLFGWRLWPSRAPGRHYTLFRNAVRLLRRPYVPAVWKFWAVVKLLLTLLLHLLFDRRRGAQARAMWRGVRDGLRAAPRDDGEQW